MLFQNDDLGKPYKRAGKPGSLSGEIASIGSVEDSQIKSAQEATPEASLVMKHEKEWGWQDLQPPSIDELYDDDWYHQESGLVAKRGGQFSGSVEAATGAHPEEAFIERMGAIGKAYWPEDHRKSPDTWHLPVCAKGAKFKLNVDVIRALLRVGRFVQAERAESPLALCIRGCALPEGRDFVQDVYELQLQQSSVNFRDWSCLLCIFEPTTERLFVYSASSVPHFSKLGWCSSGYTEREMMPTGYYRSSITIGREVRLNPAAAVYFADQHLQDAKGVSDMTLKHAVFVNGQEMASVYRALNDPAQIEAFTCLRRGSRGATVFKLQCQLGVLADGIFGRKTCRALVRKQLETLGFATATYNKKMADLLGWEW